MEDSSTSSEIPNERIAGVTRASAESSVATRNPERIRLNGWLQGSIVAPADLARVLATLDRSIDVDGCRGLVVTHSCDLLAADYSQEPVAEVLICRPIAVTEGTYEKARNPRLIHLPIEIEGVSRAFSISIHDRLFADRGLFEGITPEPRSKLGSAALLMILDWLGARYTRPAFADSFNRRRRPAAKKFEKLLRDKSQDVEDVYLQVSSERELPDDEPYAVRITLLMRGERFIDEKARKRVQMEFLVPLAEALDACEGIKVENYELIPEASFTIEHIRLNQRLDTDSFSL